MIERVSSKTKANANRAAWTDHEIIYAPYHAGGVLRDGLRLGYFRVTGSSMYCDGFSVRLGTAASSPVVRCLTRVYRADETVANSDVLDMRCSVVEGQMVFEEPLFLIKDSAWYAGVELQIPDDNVSSAPEGLTLVYHLRRARNAWRDEQAAYREKAAGIGFDRLTGSSQVYYNAKRG